MVEDKEEELEESKFVFHDVPDVPDDLDRSMFPDFVIYALRAVEQFQLVHTHTTFYPISDDGEYGQCGSCYLGMSQDEWKKSLVEKRQPNWVKREEYEKIHEQLHDKLRAVHSLEDIDHEGDCEEKIKEECVGCGEKS